MMPSEASRPLTATTTAHMDMMTRITRCHIARISAITTGTTTGIITRTGIITITGTIITIIIVITGIITTGTIR